MKNPCIGCRHEWPGCRKICPFGVMYQMEKQAERERIKAGKKKQSDWLAVYRITRKGLET